MEDDSVAFFSTSAAQNLAALFPLQSICLAAASSAGNLSWSTPVTSQISQTLVYSDIRPWKDYGSIMTQMHKGSSLPRVRYLCLNQGWTVHPPSLAASEALFLFRLQPGIWTLAEYLAGLRPIQSGWLRLKSEYSSYFLSFAFIYLFDSFRELNTYRCFQQKSQLP